MMLRHVPLTACGTGFHPCSSNAASCPAAASASPAVWPIASAPARPSPRPHALPHCFVGQSTGGDCHAPSPPAQVKEGGTVFFRESCFRQSGDRQRKNNPTHYR